MKKIKRFITMLLCAVLVCGILSVNVQAAPTDSALPSAILNKNISAGSVQKKVSDTGYYQRIPRLIDTCKTCGNVLREYIPDDYFGCSYTLDNQEVLSDCSFKVGEYKESGDYYELPCLEFDYKAVCPGTTTVTLIFYFEFDAPYESGYCDRCGAYVSCPSNYNHYYDTVTFTVTVNQDYTLTYDANGGTGAPAAQTQNSTEKSQAFTVSSTVPTRDGYTFLGWSDTEDGNVTYLAEDTITLSYTSPSKTIYAIWQAEQKYTVTYTDGVAGEAVFDDQVYSDLPSGTKTPAFEGTPEREGYVFKGWKPEVAGTVTENATYTAVWGEDKNNNGIADDEEDKYSVTYTDGVEDEEVFADQVTTGLLSGTKTPEFAGTPAREGYTFKGWSPEVAETVTGNATYTAIWEADHTPDDPDVPDDPDTPDTPDDPNTPVTPDDPDTPDDPNTPVTPDDPDTPDDPNTPVDPDTPDKPNTPVDPDTPDKPNTPVDPSTPDKPSTPVTPDDQSKPDKTNTDKTNGSDKASGTADQNKTEKASAAKTSTAPKTGDESNLILWSILMGIAVICLTVSTMTVKKWKRR